MVPPRLSQINVEDWNKQADEHKGLTEECKGLQARLNNLDPNSIQDWTADNVTRLTTATQMHLHSFQEHLERLANATVLQQRIRDRLWTSVRQAEERWAPQNGGFDEVQQPYDDRQTSALPPTQYGSNYAPTARPYNSQYSASIARPPVSYYPAPPSGEDSAYPPGQPQVQYAPPPELSYDTGVYATSQARQSSGTGHPHHRRQHEESSEGRGSSRRTR